MSNATIEQLDIRYIPLAEIHESPLNTRTHFDPVKLQELAYSMQVSAQLTPALVRPSKLEGKPGFELASGHRRRRAAAIAGLPELMAIVRDLDDATFLEILTIDNLQREDVHPLEEAQGYKNLLTLEGYNARRIAERIGKTESYVYDRLKLLQLIPELQDLFFANRFTLGHAILLARLSPTDQKSAATPPQNLYADGYGGGGLWQTDSGHATLDLPAPDEEDGPYARLQPRSVRQLQQWIDEHVRFDARDESVPQLFPETVATLRQAEEHKTKVVEITHDYHVRPEAKDADGSRTYGPTSWKRADGQENSTTCEYSVVGLIAVGEGRGDSFAVCIDKKRCTTHWGAEIRERNKRERDRANGAASAPSVKSSQPAESSWQREQRERAAAVKRATVRWEKGGDAVIRAIVPHVKKLVIAGNSAAAQYFVAAVEDGLYGIRDQGKKAAKYGVPRGTTPADLLRHLIMIALLVSAEPGDYDGSNETDLQTDLDALKIKVDVVKLLDAANPEPKKEAAELHIKKTAPKKSTAAPAKRRTAKARGL
jgi:ParB/RepB/Spo0J family partition protein